MNKAYCHHKWYASIIYLWNSYHSFAHSHLLVLPQGIPLMSGYDSWIWSHHLHLASWSWLPHFLSNTFYGVQAFLCLRNSSNTRDNTLAFSSLEVWLDSKLAYISQLHNEVDIAPIKLLRLCSMEFCNPLRVFVNRIKCSCYAPLETLIICIFNIHNCLPFLQWILGVWCKSCHLTFCVL